MMVHNIVCAYMALFPLSVLSVVSVAYLLYVRHLGGILAVANIRGGGEYGLTWHKGTDIQGTRPERHDCTKECVSVSLC